MGGLQPATEPNRIEGTRKPRQTPTGRLKPLRLLSTLLHCAQVQLSDNKWLANLMDRETLRPFALNHHAAIDSWIPGYDNGSPAGIV